MENNEAIRKAVDQALLSKVQKVREKSTEEPENAAEGNHQALLDEMPEEVRREAEEMLDAPDLLMRIVDDIARLRVAGEKTVAMTLYLIGVSRLLSKPLNGRIHGHTSTGKSFLSEQVSRLFPPEAIILANRITPQALYHMRPGSLKHRWVVCGERSRLENDETAEATRALREMQSSGKLSLLITVKIGDHLETVLIEQEGPIAYTESTTLSRVFGEDENRSLNLASDERPEQTRRIVMAATRSLMDTSDVDAIVLRHHAIQRLLAIAARRIVIPYAEALGQQFPTQRPESRRAITHVTSMIQAVTLLHHRQRETDEDGAFVATAEDYRIARFLLNGPMTRAIGGAVSDSAQRLMQRLRHRTPTKDFTTSEVYAKERFSDHAIRGWLSELAHAGLLRIVEEGGKGKSYKYQIASVGPSETHDGKTLESQPSLLPAVEDIACH